MPSNPFVQHLLYLLPSWLDPLTLATVLTVLNVASLLLPPHIRWRLRESWDLFWPPWQARTAVELSPQPGSSDRTHGRVSKEQGSSAGPDKTRETDLENAGAGASRTTKETAKSASVVQPDAQSDTREEGASKATATAKSATAAPGEPSADTVDRARRKKLEAAAAAGDAAAIATLKEDRARRRLIEAAKGGDAKAAAMLVDAERKKSRDGEGSGSAERRKADQPAAGASEGRARASSVVAGKGPDDAAGDARRQLEVAAAAGDPAVLARLKEERARRKLMEAAKAGDEKAIALLAEARKKGEQGDPRPPAEAASVQELAAETDKGPGKDEMRAERKTLEAAAAGGDAAAIVKLKEERARRKLVEAAQSGDEKARAMLRRMQAGDDKPAATSDKTKSIEPNVDKPRGAARDAPADVSGKGKARAAGERPADSASSTPTSPSSSVPTSPLSSVPTSPSSSGPSSPIDLSDPLMAGDYRPLKSVLKKSKSRPPTGRNLHGAQFLTMRGLRPHLVPFPHGFHARPTASKSSLWWNNVPRSMEHVMVRPKVAKVPEVEEAKDRDKERKRAEAKEVKGEMEGKDAKGKESPREKSRTEAAGKEERRASGGSGKSDAEDDKDTDRRALPPSTSASAAATTGSTSAVATTKDPSGPQRSKDTGAKDAGASMAAPVDKERDKSSAAAPSRPASSSSAAPAGRDLQTQEVPPDPHLQKATLVCQALLCALLYQLHQPLGTALLVFFTWQFLDQMPRASDAVAAAPTESLKPGRPAEMPPAMREKLDDAQKAGKAAQAGASAALSKDGLAEKLKVAKEKRKMLEAAIKGAQEKGEEVGKEVMERYKRAKEAEKSLMEQLGSAP
ncbi:hypothetical protein Q5752_005720 [Cryptotrichosporon argae]